MANVPNWFDANVYFVNKANAMGIDVLELKPMFEAAGYNVSNAESLYSHFVDYGMKEGISPNSLFISEEYLYNKAVDYYAKGTNITQNHVQSMKLALDQANLSPWEHYIKYGYEEGISPSTLFDGPAYMTAKLRQLQAEDPTGNNGNAWTMAALENVLKGYGLTALTHYFEYGYNEGLDAYGFDVGKPNVIPGNAFTLTSGDDSLFGTWSNDYFYAGLNYLNTNDYIDGGYGYDTLEAYLAEGDVDAYGLAVQPTVYNVERIILRAQDSYWGGGDNNTQAMFDAGNVQGYTVVTKPDGSVEATGLQYLQNDNSRATLAVEDVRSDSNKMIIAWSDADPGTYDDDSVDYLVYFNPQNLKAEEGGTSGTLELRLMDVKNAQNNGDPLTENPFDSFAFNYYASSGGAAQVVDLAFRLEDVDLYTGADATYATLLQAFQNALADWVAANPQHAGLFTIALGDPFTGTAGTGTISGVDSWTSNIGQLLVLSAASGVIDAPSTDTNVGWGVSTGRVPSVGGIAWGVDDTSTVDCPLIVTTIHLDNVARVQWGDTAPECLPENSIWGSEAGDMVVGSMANRGGVEKFEVFVDRGSWLSSLSSTNETLRMIVAKNADINEDGVNGNLYSQAYNTEPQYGQLFIGRQLDSDDHFGYMNDYGATGSSTYPDNSQATGDQWFIEAERLHNVGSWTDRAFLLATDGIEDVKVFDASDFQGNLNIGASLTNTSFDKYLRDVDGVWLNDQKNAPQATADGYTKGEFVYLLGSNHDILNMRIDSGLAADQDFKLEVSAGAGNDFINFRFSGTDVVDGTGTEQALPYIDDGITPRQILNSDHLRNVVLNGDGGNDTIKVWGPTALTANGGEGNDVIFVSQWADQHQFTGGPGGRLEVLPGTDQNAVWVFNANSANDRGIIWTTEGAQSLYNDILSTTHTVDYTGTTAANSVNTLYVTVNFKGIVSHSVAVTVAQNADNTAGTISTEALNHAIIKAINEDAVLKHLLVGKDGAGHSLLVESLIDGQMGDDLSADLTIGLWTGATPSTTNGIAAWGTNGGVQYYNPEFATFDHSSVGLGGPTDITPAAATAYVAPVDPVWDADLTGLAANGVGTYALEINSQVYFVTIDGATAANNALLATALNNATASDGTTTLGSIWTFAADGATPGEFTVTGTEAAPLPGGTPPQTTWSVIDNSTLIDGPTSNLTDGGGTAPSSFDVSVAGLNLTANDWYGIVINGELVTFQLTTGGTLADFVTDLDAALADYTVTSPGAGLINLETAAASTLDTLPDVEFLDLNGNDPTATTGTSTDVLGNDGIAEVPYSFDLVLTSLAAGAPLGFELDIDGTTYTSTAALAAGADDATLLAYIQAMVAGSDWTVADDIGAVAGTLTFTNSTVTDPAVTTPPTVEVALYTGVIADPVDGSDIGTYSLNRVWGGGGDDVIVLNAGSGVDTWDGVTTNWHDVLEYHGVTTGSEGNDIVYNFQIGADQIDFSAYGNTHMISASGTQAGATLTAAEAAAILTRDGYAASSSGGALIQDATNADKYWVTKVVNDSTTPNAVVENEVVVVGSVTFDNDTGSLLGQADLVFE